MGVRRVGKSVLSQSLSDVRYYDCELPRVRRLVEDPQAFLEAHEGARIVLDEVHRLANPAEVLKIAADHFSDVQGARHGILHARRLDEVPGHPGWPQG